VFFENPLLVGDPEGADPGRERAIGCADKRRTGLRVGRACDQTKSKKQNPRRKTKTRIHSLLPTSFPSRKQENNRIIGSGAILIDFAGLNLLISAHAETASYRSR
jgi:hypothetical protein